MSRRDEDWDCPQCGNDNFASRDKCKKCGCFKSKIPRPGDWKCYCGEINFAKRLECRRCSKPHESVSAFDLRAQQVYPVPQPSMFDIRSNQQ